MGSWIASAREAEEEGKELVWQITEALAGTEVGGGETEEGGEGGEDSGEPGGEGDLTVS